MAEGAGGRRSPRGGGDGTGSAELMVALRSVELRGTAGGEATLAAGGHARQGSLKLKLGALQVKTDAFRITNGTAYFDKAYAFQVTKDDLHQDALLEADFKLRLDPSAALAARRSRRFGAQRAPQFVRASVAIRVAEVAAVGSPDNRAFFPLVVDSGAAQDTAMAATAHDAMAAAFAALELSVFWCRSSDKPTSIAPSLASRRSFRESFGRSTSAQPQATAIGLQLAVKAKDWVDNHSGVATWEGYSKLHVEIIEAKGLLPASSGGARYPFCDVLCRGTKFKTAVVRRSLNPTWKQSFSFSPLDGIDQDDEVQIIVRSEATVKRADDLGQVVIPLWSSSSGRSPASPRWLELAPTLHMTGSSNKRAFAGGLGWVRVAVTFSPASNLDCLMTAPRRCNDVSLRRLPIGELSGAQCISPCDADSPTPGQSPKAQPPHDRAAAQAREAPPQVSPVTARMRSTNSPRCETPQSAASPHDGGDCSPGSNGRGAVSTPAFSRLDFLNPATPPSETAFRSTLQSNQLDNLTKPLLQIKVVQARNLNAADFNGFSDPFCEVACKGAKVKTRTVSSTLAPAWNEEFYFGEHEYLRDSDTVTLTVYDEDLANANDKLGSVTIPIFLLRSCSGENEPTWFPLQSPDYRTAGEVQLTARYYPSVSAAQDEAARKTYKGMDWLFTVEVAVLNARGLVSPFGGQAVSASKCVVSCGSEPRRNTRVQKRTNNPTWNEKFRFSQSIDSSRKGLGRMDVLRIDVCDQHHRGLAKLQIGLGEILDRIGYVDKQGAEITDIFELEEPDSNMLSEPGQADESDAIGGLVERPSGFKSPSFKHLAAGQKSVGQRLSSPKVFRRFFRSPRHSRADTELSIDSNSVRSREFSEDEDGSDLDSPSFSERFTSASEQMRRAAKNQLSPSGMRRFMTASENALSSTATFFGSHMHGSSDSETAADGRGLNEPSLPATAASHGDPGSPASGVIATGARWGHSLYGAIKLRVRFTPIGQLRMLDRTKLVVQLFKLRNFLPSQLDHASLSQRDPRVPTFMYARCTIGDESLESEQVMFHNHHGGVAVFNSLFVFHELDRVIAALVAGKEGTADPASQTVTLTVFDAASDKALVESSWTLQQMGRLFDDNKPRWSKAASLNFCDGSDPELFMQFKLAKSIEEIRPVIGKFRLSLHRLKLHCRTFDQVVRAVVRYKDQTKASRGVEGQLSITFDPETHSYTFLVYDMFSPLVIDVFADKSRSTTEAEGEATHSIRSKTRGKLLGSISLTTFDLLELEAQIVHTGGALFKQVTWPHLKLPIVSRNRRRGVLWVQAAYEEIISSVIEVNPNPARRQIKPSMSKTEALKLFYWTKATLEDVSSLRGGLSYLLDWNNVAHTILAIFSVIMICTFPIFSERIFALPFYALMAYMMRTHHDRVNGKLVKAMTSEARAMATSARLRVAVLGASELVHRPHIGQEPLSRKTRRHSLTGSVRRSRSVSSLSDDFLSALSDSDWESRRSLNDTMSLPTDDEEEVADFGRGESDNESDFSLEEERKELADDDGSARHRRTRSRFRTLMHKVSIRVPNGSAAPAEPKHKTSIYEPNDRKQSLRRSLRATGSQLMLGPAARAHVGLQLRVGTSHLLRLGCTPGSRPTRTPDFCSSKVGYRLERGAQTKFHSAIIDWEDKAQGSIPAFEAQVPFQPSFGKVITVCVLSAQDLLGMDSTGLSDPFVTVKLLSSTEETKDKRQTTVRSQTLAPEWDHTMIFGAAVEVAETDLMEFNVYDADNLKRKDPLAYLLLPVANIAKLFPSPDSAAQIFGLEPPRSGKAASRSFESYGSIKLHLQSFDFSDPRAGSRLMAHLTRLSNMAIDHEVSESNSACSPSSQSQVLLQDNDEYAARSSHDSWTRSATELVVELEDSINKQFIGEARVPLAALVQNEDVQRQPIFDEWVPLSLRMDGGRQDTQLKADLRALQGTCGFVHLRVELDLPDKGARERLIELKNAESAEKRGLKFSVYRQHYEEFYRKVHAVNCTLEQIRHLFSWAHPRKTELVFKVVATLALLFTVVPSRYIIMFVALFMFTERFRGMGSMAHRFKHMLALLPTNEDLRKACTSQVLAAKRRWPTEDQSEPEERGATRVAYAATNSAPHPAAPSPSAKGSGPDQSRGSEGERPLAATPRTEMTGASPRRSFATTPHCTTIRASGSRRRKDVTLSELLLSAEDIEEGFGGNLHVQVLAPKTFFGSRTEWAIMYAFLLLDGRLAWWFKRDAFDAGKPPSCVVQCIVDVEAHVPADELLGCRQPDLAFAVFAARSGRNNRLDILSTQASTVEKIICVANSERKKWLWLARLREAINHGDGN